MREYPTKAFSMIEMVLALGIFSFAVLPLIGLLISSLNSAGKLIDFNQVAAITAEIDAFLQSRENAFETVYSWMENGECKSLLLYATSDDREQWNSEESPFFPRSRSDYLSKTIRILGYGGSNPDLIKEELSRVEGSAFKIKICDSLVYEWGEEGHNDPENLGPYSQYEEAFLALTIRIYAYSPHPSMINALCDEHRHDEKNEIMVYPYALNR